MNETATIERILGQVKHWDYATKLDLIERLLRLLKKENIEVQKTTRKLSDLSGLGSEIWKEVNIDQYIQEQRQWD